MRRAAHLRGFTLIELVMVIVLTGALFAGTAIFLVGPTTAYADLTRRAQLVDSADLALRRMARDIRAAVPNSVITPTASSLSLFDTVSGGRYRAAANASSGDVDSILEFNRSDASFDVEGGFPGVASLSSSTHRLVVFNLGTSGSDVYAGSDVITPAGTQITVAGERVTLSPAFQFRWPSPQQRIYLSAGRIDYSCAGGRLLRSVNGAAGAVVTDHVAACDFTYIAGSASRSAVVTLRITLTDGDESIRLLRQVHVENLP